MEAEHETSVLKSPARPAKGPPKGLLLSPKLLKMPVTNLTSELDPHFGMFVTVVGVRMRFFFTQPENAVEEQVSDIETAL